MGVVLSGQLETVANFKDGQEVELRAKLQVPRTSVVGGRGQIFIPSLIEQKT
jgi:hypothetical protein